jgi:proton-coupled amino acid transporter
MLHYRAVARTTYARVIDVLVCIIGLVGMVYTTTLTINSWVAGGTEKAPGYCDGRMP